MPGVMPNAATATAVSTNQTPSTVHEKFGDAERVRTGEQPGDEVAEQPVDGQRRQPAAEPGGRSRARRGQAEPLAGVVSRTGDRAGYAAVPGIHDSIQRATLPA